MSVSHAGLVQHRCTPDREENIRRSTEGVRAAAARGANLVVLQELHQTPYFCQTEDPACFDLAEPVPGPSTETFAALARELDVVLVTSLFERGAPGLYHNTAAVFDADGSLAGIYRKMHIPDDPGYYEKFYFTPGDLGFTPIDTRVGRLGVLVCWDQWYPEAARLMALAGAELAIVTPIAGTPRDVVQQTIQIEGVPLHVLDTAGLRQSSDEVERIGIERAWSHIESADALLLLHDLTRVAAPDYAAEDRAIRAAIAEKLPPSVPVIHLWNKQDAAPGAAVPEGDIALSARTGDGLDALRQRLLQVVGWQAGAGDGVFIARQRHLQALAAADAHLEAASAQLAGAVPLLELLAEELRLAQRALSEITGEFSADDLLGVIFARFCIGK